MSQLCCSTCQAYKDPTEFYPDARHKTGLQSRCRGCQKARRPKTTSRKLRLGIYGLTEADYFAILAAQDGHCALCPTASTIREGEMRRGEKRGSLAVDHCHDCEDIDRRGSVRGLLCHSCNLKHRCDDLDHLRARIAYLEIHAAVCPA